MLQQYNLKFETHGFSFFFWNFACNGGLFSCKNLSIDNYRNFHIIPCAHVTLLYLSSIKYEDNLFNFIFHVNFLKKSSIKDRTTQRNIMLDQPPLPITLFFPLFFYS